MKYEHLVSTGSAGSVGRFSAASPGLAARGDRVVVVTERGTELGTVLAADTDAGARYLPDAPLGQFLRRAGHEDEEEQLRREVAARELLAEAERRAAGRPVSFLDAEAVLDGRTVVLHALAWGECSLDGLLAELGAEFGTQVRLFDVGRTPVAKEPAGCGKPGCGSEGGGGCGSGGGCSSGGCSRGSVKKAEEMTAYFADLRRKMEDAGLVRTALL